MSSTVFPESEPGGEPHPDNGYGDPEVESSLPMEIDTAVLSHVMPLMLGHRADLSFFLTARPGPEEEERPSWMPEENPDE